MQAFTKLTGVAAPLALANVDTDQIIPGRFLKTVQRSGLGEALFADLRFDPDGREKPSFILNRGAFRHASILIARENFGCGSSREHAAWALLDFGIRCIVAPSFGDIFRNNAVKNGILPVILPRAQCDRLMDDAGRDPAASVTVGLAAQRVLRSNGDVFDFPIDAFSKRMLLNGLDHIDLTLQHTDSISRFEQERASRLSWMTREIPHGRAIRGTFRNELRTSRNV
jgi:3-isopropylmalate/(R)-2-methylmalate dehydratase small subunit